MKLKFIQPIRVVFQILFKSSTNNQYKLFLVCIGWPCLVSHHLSLPLVWDPTQAQPYNLGPRPRHRINTRFESVYHIMTENKLTNNRRRFPVGSSANSQVLVHTLREAWGG